MSQTGTAAPIAIELENSLGNIVWTRSSAGSYYGTLSGAFPITKTFALSIQAGGYDTDVLNGGGGDVYNLVRLNDNVLVLSTTGDTILNYSPIEIRVYN
jgi:hypothetical protein